MYPEGLPTFCDPRVMESSSENVDARLGEFAIICNFFLKRLQYISRFIAL